jgi:hypothetical protein
MVSVTFANMARYLVAWLFTYASSCWCVHTSQDKTMR